ncbi:MAG TPA: DUF1289 domain-containing protein [Armatimonadetes bacterium]|nr:DUF1289 domain-containing protein [Armatimonadota bacterium]
MSDAERPFSPCIQQCHFDTTTRRCSGCHRTMEEISGWVSFSSAQRERIWARIERLRAATGTPAADEIL